MNSLKKTVASLGVGWFAIQVIWTVYNAFMPLFYGKLTERLDPVTGAMVPNLTLVGLLMTTDNLAAGVLGPFWGARSDRTRSPLGRRMPFILLGMPLAALCTFLLPTLSGIGLAALVAGALAMNFFMTIFRTPFTSFFSDLFPSSTRSQVSGITDLCSGIGAIVALLGGGQLFKLNPAYPFILAGVVLLIATLVLKLGIKEPAPEAVTATADRAGELPDGAIAALKTILRMPQKSPLLMLIGVVFVWGAWNAIESFWTTFATRALGMDGGDAANFAAILALSYLVGAVPSGIAAAKFGRHRVIMAGLFGLIPLYIFGSLNTSVVAFAVLLGVIGLLWSLVLVNGVILFQEFASLRQIGLFTGIYAVGSAVAQVACPPLYGFLMDRGGPHMLWYAGTAALIVGALVFSRVREGRVFLDGDAGTPKLEPAG